MSMRITVSLLLIYTAACTGYQENERVKLWVNKVGPLYNPLETYEYFSLNLCRPPAKDWNEEFPSLGEALQGDELVEHTSIELKFKRDTKPTAVCTEVISPETASRLKEAIQQKYWYQFYVDDLPLWGNLGNYSESTSQAFIFKHQHFSVGFNGNKIVYVDLVTQDEVELTDKGESIEFTYSVEWKKMTLPYENRFRRYLDNKFFEHKVHWFSLVNSFLMAFFLVVFVLYILSRTVHADYVRYQPKDEEMMEQNEDSGWKQVRGEVFRQPAFPSLLISMVGTGHQLGWMAFFVIVQSAYSTVYASRGALLTSSILIWSVTSFLSGFFSSGLFCRFAVANPAFSSKWIRTMLMTAVLFPGSFVVLVFLMNFVAWGYHSARAIPFGTMLAVLGIWGFGAFPLTVLGTIYARTRKLEMKVPHINTVPRTIPPKKLYTEPFVLILLGGMLPFGTIFIELYFVFTAFWDYKLYYVYGFMLLAFFILVVSTLCVSIVCTYFLLNSEDPRWHWTSFGTGASIGLYTFLYAVYFFFNKTKMSGLLNFTLYFGYSALMSFGFSILTGSIAFAAAHIFVRTIYHSIKGE